MSPSEAVVPSTPFDALVRVNSKPIARTGKPGRGRTVQWQPPEGVTAAQVKAVIDATETERDRLLLRTLWATGARVSEVLALRPRDVRGDHVVLPNLKNPGRLVKTVFLPPSEAGLTGALHAYAMDQGIADHEPIFQSRQRRRDGTKTAMTRQQVRNIVQRASEKAGVLILALRASQHGPAGEPAPIHTHVFRHARVRQNLRDGVGLPVVQKQAGWAKLQLAYLSPSDEDVRQAMSKVGA